MNARKAAAVSAASAMLIAGCAGGKGSGGASLPAAGQGARNTAAPASSSRISLSFSMSARQSPAWGKTFYTPAFKTSKRTTKSRVAATSSMFGKKQPQYISPAVMGGSIYVYIYQGASLALTDGPFSVGTTYGASDFYCSTNPVTYVFNCTNPTTPVFAPYGNDTFFVAMYDAYHHLLSVTPGIPGTSLYGPAQPSYTITSSGYPYPIGIATYPVMGTFGIDTETSCVDPSGGAGTVATVFLDGGGYPFSGSYIANPVTVSLTGGWSLYSAYAGGPVATPYTIYSTYDDFELVASSDGATGTISISGAGAPSSINGLASQMNLYAVDRLALSATGSAINVTGLVDSGPAAFACGTLPIASPYTGAPIALSNPVAIGGDDFLPGVAVVENASNSPYIEAVELNRFAFGFSFPTFTAAMPALGAQLGGGAPLEVAVSPDGDGVGNHKIYVLSADGSIQSLDTQLDTAATVEAAGTISGPVGLDVLWEGTETGDSLVATSSTTANLFEIDSANSSPSLSTFNITSLESPVFVTPTTSSVFADNITGLNYVSFLAFDSGQSNEQFLVESQYPGLGEEGIDGSFGSGSAQSAGMLSMAYPSGTPYWLVASGNTVKTFQVGASIAGTTSPFPTFGNPVTRIITTYDGAWNGIASGGVFQFFYSMSGTASGTLIGTRAVIVSPIAAY